MSLTCSQAYLCQQCLCREWQSVLSCSGGNITDLPHFNDTTWIRHVDILNTSITDISQLTSFKNLYSTDIRFNWKLSCASILELKSIMYTVTDCDDAKTSFIEPSTVDMDEKPTDWMSLMSLSPIIFIIALMAYLKNKMNTILKQLTNTPTYAPCDQMTDERPRVQIETLV